MYRWPWYARHFYAHHLIRSPQPALEVLALYPHLTGKDTETQMGGLLCRDHIAKTWRRQTGIHVRLAAGPVLAGS